MSTLGTACRHSRALVWILALPPASRVSWGKLLRFLEAQVCVCKVGINSGAHGLGCGLNGIRREKGLVREVQWKAARSPPRGSSARLCSTPCGRCWGYRNEPPVAVVVTLREVRVQGKGLEALSPTQGIQ